MRWWCRLRCQTTQLHLIEQLPAQSIELSHREKQAFLKLQHQRRQLPSGSTQPPELCHVNRPDQVPGVGTCSVRSEDGEPRTAAVLYSLGNFGTIMPTMPCQVGIAAEVTLDPDVTGLGWTPVVSVDSDAGLTVFPAGDVDDDDTMSEVNRLQQHIGEGWRR